MNSVARVTIWNEFIHENINSEVSAIYPDGIHQCIAGFLGKSEGIETHTATLEEPDHGLSDEVLQSTDVLLWWGHKAHDKVSDEIVKKVHKRVLEGMGFIGLHSAHYSKIFRSLLGTECSLKWRDDGEKRETLGGGALPPYRRGAGRIF